MNSDELFDTPPKKLKGELDLLKSKNPTEEWDKVVKQKLDQAYEEGSELQKMLNSKSITKEEISPTNINRLMNEMTDIINSLGKNGNNLEIKPVFNSLQDLLKRIDVRLSRIEFCLGIYGGPENSGQTDKDK